MEGAVQNSKSFSKRGQAAPRGSDLFIPGGTQIGHLLGWDAEEKIQMSHGCDPEIHGT